MIRDKDTSTVRRKIVIAEATEHDLGPRFGRAVWTEDPQDSNEFTGWALVQEGLRQDIKNYVTAHEIFHLVDPARWWFWREIKANASWGFWLTPRAGSSASGCP